MRCQLRRDAAAGDPRRRRNRGDASLPGSHNPAICWEDDYTAPWRDEALIAALPQGAWDGEVVRHARYESGPGTQPRMVLQRARYFDYIGTNLSPKDCEHTDALGIATLLSTSDGHCILHRRSPDFAIRYGLLGPGVSGTVKPDDLKGATLLSQLDARRESREELGVSNDFGSHDGREPPPSAPALGALRLSGWNGPSGQLASAKSPGSSRWTADALSGSRGTDTDLQRRHRWLAPRQWRPAERRRIRSRPRSRARVM